MVCYEDKGYYNFQSRGSHAIEWVPKLFQVGHISDSSDTHPYLTTLSVPTVTCKCNHTPTLIIPLQLVDTTSCQSCPSRTNHHFFSLLICISQFKPTIFIFLFPTLSIINKTSLILSVLFTQDIYILNLCNIVWVTSHSINTWTIDSTIAKHALRKYYLRAEEHLQIKTEKYKQKHTKNTKNTKNLTWFDTSKSISKNT